MTRTKCGSFAECGVFAVVQLSAEITAVGVLALRGLR
jgi:hypothetical protein